MQIVFTLIGMERWLGSVDRGKIQIDVTRPLSGNIIEGVTYLLLLLLNGPIDSPIAMAIMNIAFILRTFLTTLGTMPPVQNHFVRSARSKNFLCCRRRHIIMPINWNLSTIDILFRPYSIALGYFSRPRSFLITNLFKKHLQLLLWKPFLFT